MRRSSLAVLLVSAAALFALSEAEAAEVDPIVGRWNYSGGVVEVTGSGTHFVGTVVKKTRFSEWAHPAGEVM